MFLINLNAEIVACTLSFRKYRQKPNLENTSKSGFSPDLGGKNGGVLSMRMQVILDSSFARPGSAPISQGPEEMCLSLEYQNPSKTSEIMGYFDRVTVSLHVLYTANQVSEGSQDRLTVQNTEREETVFGADFPIPETQMELSEIA